MCLMLRIRDQAPRFKGSAAGTRWEGGGGGGEGATIIDGNFASAPCVRQCTGVRDHLYMTSDGCKRRMTKDNSVHSYHGREKVLC